MEEDLTQVAIREFISSSDGSKHTKVILKDNKLVDKNYILKSSRIINKNISRSVRSEIVADIVGTGELRELTVVADTSINVVLKVDGENLLEGISRWSELNAITSYTDTIIALVDNDKYIFSIKKIRFTKDIFLQVYFDSNSTISSVFGIYDLFKGV